MPDFEADAKKLNGLSSGDRRTTAPIGTATPGTTHAVDFDLTRITGTSTAGISTGTAKAGVVPK